MKLKTKTAWIIFCLLAPAAVVYLLYAFTFRPNREKNGFTRRFSTLHAIPLDTLIAEKRFSEICGLTDHSLFIALADRRTILETDWTLQKEHYHTFPLPTEEKIMSRIQYQVDSPVYNIFAGNGPDVFKGLLYTKDPPRHFHYGWPVFVRSIALPNGLYLFQGFDYNKAGTQQDFILWDPLGNNQLKKYDPFQPAADMDISSEGLISYDTALHLLVYAQFYKNGLYTFDSNLAPAGHATTLDTVHTGRMRAGRTNRSGILEYSAQSPQFIINGQLCLDDGKAYVNSLLKADNEDGAGFDDYSAIDVYDLRTLHYLYSFQLPRLQGKRLISLRIRGDKAAATYAGGIVVYRLEH